MKNQMKSERGKVYIKSNLKRKQREIIRSEAKRVREKRKKRSMRERERERVRVIRLTRVYYDDDD